MDASSNVWNSVFSTDFLDNQTLRSTTGIESPGMDRNIDEQETDFDNQSDKGSGLEKTDSSVEDSPVMSDFNSMIDILPIDSVPESGDDDCSAVSSTKKRKRSIVPSDRINRARLLKTMSMYEVEQSKKKPGQQRALDWLSYLAKDRFGEEHVSLLAKWGGVKVGHKGTCILCLED